METQDPPPTPQTSIDPIARAVLPGAMGHAPRRAAAWPGALMAALVVIMALPAIWNAAAARNPLQFNDDARQQIWPFLRSVDREFFPNDVIADYYLDCMPIGFKGLYFGAAKIIDPRSFSKVLPYVLLAGFAGLAGITASRLEGRLVGWATAAICLGAPLFLDRLGGGLPRGFAFPLYALAAAALVTGRPIVMACVVCVGAAFYPTVSVTCGLGLAAWLLLLPPHSRGRAIDWSLGRRIGVVVAAAVVTALVSLPSQMAMRPWGQILRSSDVAEFPEVGPGGRYAAEDRPMPMLSRIDLEGYVRPVLGALGAPTEGGKSILAQPLKTLPILVFALVGAYGYLTLAVRDVRAMRLLLLAAAALIAHLVAIPLSPYLYLPARYQTYPLAVLAVIVVPVGIATLPFRFARPADVPAARSKVVAIVCGGFLAFLFLIDSRSVRAAGLNHSAESHASMYEYIHELPAFTRIAGWPPDMDDVPYVAERPILVGRETHQAFHSRYALLMRERANAVIDALYSPDVGPLLRLRDEMGVSYLIVERGGHPTTAPARKKFRAGGDDEKWVYGAKAPSYFAPFDARIADARRALGALQPAALRAIPLAAVHADGDWVLLDLDRLPSRSVQAGVLPQEPTTQPTSQPAP